MTCVFISINPSFQPLSVPASSFQGYGGHCSPYPTITVRGGGAGHKSPSRGETNETKKTFTLLLKLRDNIELPINLAAICLVSGRKPKVPGKIPPMHGKNIQTLHRKGKGIWSGNLFAEGRQLYQQTFIFLFY